MPTVFCEQRLSSRATSVEATSLSVFAALRVLRESATTLRQFVGFVLMTGLTATTMAQRKAIYKRSSLAKAMRRRWRAWKLEKAVQAIVNQESERTAHVPVAAAGGDTRQVL